jgi:hypothetical protein
VLVGAIREARGRNLTRDEVTADRFIWHGINLIKFATCRKWANLSKQIHKKKKKESLLTDELYTDMYLLE